MARQRHRTRGPAPMRRVRRLGGRTEVLQRVDPIIRRPANTPRDTTRQIRIEVGVRGLWGMETTGHAAGINQAAGARSLPVKHRGADAALLLTAQTGEMATSLRAPAAISTPAPTETSISATTASGTSMKTARGMQWIGTTWRHNGNRQQPAKWVTATRNCQKGGDLVPEERRVRKALNRDHGSKTEGADVKGSRALREIACARKLRHSRWRKARLLAFSPIRRKLVEAAMSPIAYNPMPSSPLANA